MAKAFSSSTDLSIPAKTSHQYRRLWKFSRVTGISCSEGVLLNLEIACLDCNWRLAYEGWPEVRLFDTPKRLKRVAHHLSPNSLNAFVLPKAGNDSPSRTPALTTHQIGLFRFASGSRPPRASAATHSSP